MSEETPGSHSLSSPKSKLALSPLATLIVTGIVGLISAGVGASVQGYWTTKLERQKFEAALIQDALTPPAIEDRKKKLQFLIDIGLITSLDPAKLSEAIETNNLPPSTPGLSGIAGNTLICVLNAAGGLPQGAGGDAEQLRNALMEFQKANQLLPDGFVGQATLLTMQQRAPSCFQ